MNKNRIEVQHVHQERDFPSERLLLEARAFVSYYPIEEGNTTTLTNENHDCLPKLKLSLSVPELLFELKPWIKEYIEIKEAEAVEAFKSNFRLLQYQLRYLAEIAMEYPKIEEFFLPDFALTSFDFKGQIDIVKLDRVKEIYGEENKWVNLAYYELLMNYGIDVQKYPTAKERLQLLALLKKDKEIHPWIGHVLEGAWREK